MRKGYSFGARLAALLWLIVCTLFAIMVAHTPVDRPDAKETAAPQVKIAATPAQRQVDYQPLPGAKVMSMEEGEADMEATMKPILRMSLKILAWRKGGFDNVMIADISIFNKNKFDIKDIRVRCFGVARSGTQLGTSEGTIYEIIKAGKSRVFRDVNLGFIDQQIATEGCELIDAKQSFPS